MPSPLYPGLQVHVRLPGVLMHVALLLQPPLPVRHSLTSSQLVWLSLTRYPVVQLATKHPEPLHPILDALDAKGQGEQAAPHVATALLGTHELPQRW